MYVIATILRAAHYENNDLTTGICAAEECEASFHAVHACGGWLY